MRDLTKYRNIIFFARKERKRKTLIKIYLLRCEDAREGEEVWREVHSQEKEEMS